MSLVDEYKAKQGEAIIFKEASDYENYEKCIEWLKGFALAKQEELKWIIWFAGRWEGLIVPNKLIKDTLKRKDELEAVVIEAKTEGVIQ